LWAAKSLAQETAKAFHYVGAALALLGLWRFRRRLRSDAGLWLLAVLAVLHALILWRVAVVKGYVSERHVLLIVLVGSIWIGAIVVELGRIIGSLWKGFGKQSATIVLAASFLLSGIPSIVRPLHANRAGHHAAGCWLAHHATNKDEVVDPFCWAHFYSGSMFREGSVIPAGHIRYVVLEQSDNPHTRLPLMGLARSLAEKGEPVYHWPEKQPLDRALVVVYRVAPEK